MHGTGPSPLVVQALQVMKIHLLEGGLLRSLVGPCLRGMMVSGTSPHQTAPYAPPGRLSPFRAGGLTRARAMKCQSWPAGPPLRYAGPACFKTEEGGYKPNQITSEKFRVPTLFDWMTFIVCDKK